MCAAVCPQYFEINEKDNLADLKHSKINNQGLEELTIEDAENMEALKDAAMSCPAEAITLEE